jgi:hypothetical protein
MGLVVAADFLERVATDAVDNGEEASFVTRGGGAAVLSMGNLLLSWYSLALGDLAIVQGWVCSADFCHLFPEVMQFGLRYSTLNVYYEGDYGASEV